MPIVPISARRLAMDTLVDLCRKVRGGRYVVKRGYVDWASWTFEANQHVISIVSRSEPLFESDLLDPSNWSIEFGSRLPRDPAEAMVDDGLLDEFLDDARSVLHDLGQSNKPGTKDGVLKLFYGSDAEVTSFSNSVDGVQGITVQFAVVY